MNAILPLVIGIGVFAFVSLMAYILIQYGDERMEARASLRTLDDYEMGDTKARGRRRAIPKKDPADQLMHRMTALARRFTPEGYIESVRTKLRLAGRQRNDEVDTFLAKMALSFCFAAAWFLFYLLFLHSAFSGLLAVAVWFVPVLFGLLGPSAVLARAVAARQLALRRTLPDTMDLLTISVEAGLGFEQAIDRVVSSVPGPLSEEFNRMLGELRAGSSRSEALAGIDERCGLPEVKSFVMAIRQADMFGISIARILRTQSEEMRVKRRQLAQELAQKVPVKMLIPMVFCIFPSIFLIVLGPAMIQIVHAFKT